MTSLQQNPHTLSFKKTSWGRSLGYIFLISSAKERTMFCPGPPFPSSHDGDLWKVWTPLQTLPDASLFCPVLILLFTVITHNCDQNYLSILWVLLKKYQKPKWVGTSSPKHMVLKINIPYILGQEFPKRCAPPKQVVLPTKQKDPDPESIYYTVEANKIPAVMVNVRIWKLQIKPKIKQAHVKEEHRGAHW